MKSRLVAIAVFLFLPGLLLLAADSFDCRFRSCVVDDASARGLAYFGIPLLIAQAVVAAPVLLPAIVTLKPKFGALLSSVCVAAIASLVVAGVLHSPVTDGFFLRTWIFVGMPLTFAWSIAGFVACAFWPNNSFSPDALERAD